MNIGTSPTQNGWMPHMRISSNQPKNHPSPMNPNSKRPTKRPVTKNDRTHASKGSVLSQSFPINTPTAPTRAQMSRKFNSIFLFFYYYSNKRKNLKSAVSTNSNKTSHNFKHTNLFSNFSVSY